MTTTTTMTAMMHKKIGRLWIYQLPLILLFGFAFWLMVAVETGSITNTPFNTHFFRETTFKSLRRVSGLFTDFKFWVRGRVEAKNKIVIVEVDNQSIENEGRWPWHRDKTAALIENTFALGAKAVGLDMVFSESDRRVPDELHQFEKQKGLNLDLKKFETDPLLAQTIERHADRLVLGWTPIGECRPAYHSDLSPCDVNNAEALQRFEMSHTRFSERNKLITPDSGFDGQKTAIMSFHTALFNLPEFNERAKNAGFFVSLTDPDGVVRRVPLFILGMSSPYLSLGLEMARVGLNESVEIKTTPKFMVDSLRFANSGREFPLTSQGVFEVNFRGPEGSFPYVSATSVLHAFERGDAQGRQLASLNELSSTIKDAYVFIGVSGVGTNDLRNFPTDSAVPGVEGHANILDNLLSGDGLIPSSNGGFRAGSASFWILLMMVLLAIALAIATEKLEALPAMAFVITVFLALGFFDVQILFARNHTNWNTGLLYLEMGLIAVLTLGMKYRVEMQNKAQIKSAFAKYVSPAIVDRIVEDPEKLMLGGERRELSILFSDIRGFTSFSESMDAKDLSNFLNDYLGIMTDLVFANDGTLDKYIGDAVMAFWGAPLDQPAHAKNAARTAIAMMKALHEHRPRFKQQYGVEVDIGIGVNTGQVSVGNMGCDKNFEYTVIGDHVNLASRLEGLTKYYGVSIVTTRTTLKEAGEELAHRVLDFVKVKGKAQAVELIQLLDKEISAEALQKFEQARALYVAREWDQATVLFKQVVEACGGKDGPSEMYIERIEEFKQTPPEADWDGSYKMSSK